MGKPLPTLGIRQWKRELEVLRWRIGHEHDRVVERMRADETSLLEALFSFEQPRRTSPLDVTQDTADDTVASGANRRPDPPSLKSPVSPARISENNSQGANTTKTAPQ